METSTIHVDKYTIVPWMGVGSHDPGEAMNLAKQMLHREDFFGANGDFQIGVGCVRALGSFPVSMYIQADGVGFKTNPLE